MIQKIEFIQSGTDFELKLQCRLGAAPSALEMVREAVQALAEHHDPEGLMIREALRGLAQDEGPDSLIQSALLP